VAICFRDYFDSYVFIDVVGVGPQRPAVIYRVIGFWLALVFTLLVRVYMLEVSFRENLGRNFLRALHFKGGILANCYCLSPHWLHMWRPESGRLRREVGGA